MHYNFSFGSLGDVFSDAHLISFKGIRISKPKNVHPLDSDIIYFDSICHIVSFNIKTQTLQVVKHSNHDTGSNDGWSNAFPFVVPSWPTVIPRSSSN